LGGIFNSTGFCLANAGVRFIDADAEQIMLQWLLEWWQDCLSASN